MWLLCRRRNSYSVNSRAREIYSPRRCTASRCFLRNASGRARGREIYGVPPITARARTLLYVITKIAGGTCETSRSRSQIPRKQMPAAFVANYSQECQERADSCADNQRKCAEKKQRVRWLGSRFCCRACEKVGSTREVASDVQFSASVVCHVQLTGRLIKIIALTRDCDKNQFLRLWRQQLLLPMLFQTPISITMKMMEKF